MTTAVSSAEGGIGAGEHAVLFYDRDSDLAEAVAGFLADALRAGGGAIVVATEAHRRAFAAQLASVGLDLPAVGERAAAWLDAAELLATFMPAGRIDAEAFHREIGSAITKAGAGGRPVYVYGEMVQLLWDAGQVVAAVELERLWNEVMGEYRCSLMCAYRSSSVSGAEHAEALQRVCALHSSVLHRPIGQVMQNTENQSGPEAVAQLLPEPTAPRDARRFVTDTLRRTGHNPALVEDAEVVVSELATNAVVHARSAFSVAVRSLNRGARLSVRDASPRRPMIPARSPGTLGGCGLRLVAALATEWGVEPTPAGKTVWAELKPRVPPTLVSAATTLAERPSPANAPAPARSAPRTGRSEGSELAALYSQVADTLEQSAELAERHARREQDSHREPSATVELERAKRARQGARRARDLAAGMQEQHAPDARLERERKAEGRTLADGSRNVSHVEQWEASASRREHGADERDRIADERERVADVRERTADERERLADEREGTAEQREVERRDRGEATLARRRHAERREQAQINREIAATEREVARQERDEEAARDPGGGDSEDEAD